MAQRKHESPEIGAMMQRMLRSLVKRAGEGDTEALEQLAQLELATSEALTTAGGAMHAHYSWTELGEVLGVSRQAARQRFHSSTHAVSCPSCTPTEHEVHRANMVARAAAESGACAVGGGVIRHRGSCAECQARAAVNRERVAASA